MSDPRLDYKNEYPVELVAPDISCYKNTGSGLDYIVTIDSGCLLYTSPSPRDRTRSRMPSSA